MGLKIKNFIINKILKADMFSIIVTCIVLFLLLTIFTDSFATKFNLLTMLKTASVTMVIGMGQMMALAVGQFNIALGGMGACGAMMAGYMMHRGLPIFPSVLACLAVAAFLGWIQGILITKSKMNPFIVTLSLSFIYYGGAIALTRAAVFVSLPDAFNKVATTDIFGVIPGLFIIAFALMTILFIFMYKISFGRKMLVTGSNSVAAFFAGIQTNNIITLAHTMSGFIAGIGALLVMMRLGSAQVSIGNDWMLLSCAATVLGGTLLSGGKIGIYGTIFGAYLMAMINNGLVLIGINYYWFGMFTGIVLIITFESRRNRGGMLKIKESGKKKLE